MAEVFAELRFVLSDPAYRLADRARYAGSSALGSGRGSSITTTQAKRAREFSNEEFALGLSLSGPLGVPA